VVWKIPRAGGASFACSRRAGRARQKISPASNATTAASSQSRRTLMG
jgi:hypothetical protein